MPTSRKLFLRTALLLTLFTLLLGAEHFARFDLLGISHEANFKDYVTETGRVITPASIDEGQYMAYVEIYRDRPKSEMSQPTVWAPFNERVGVPWLAHFLPIRDEGVALAVTNIALYLVGLWSILAAIRRIGARPAAFLFTGFFLAFNWNTVWFSSSVMVDTGVLAFMGLGCYLLATRRPWWVVPMFAVAYPLKETCLLLLVVVAAWCWKNLRSRPVEMVAVIGSSTLLAAAGFALTHGTLKPDRVFDNSMRWSVAIGNLDLIGWIPIAAGFGVLLILALLQIRHRWRSGWWAAVSDPMAVGVFAGIAVLIYSMFGADLSPRLFFPGLPFAAVLSAQWLDDRGQNLLARFWRLLHLPDRFAPQAQSSAR